jgi:hypothetical protein
MNKYRVTVVASYWQTIEIDAQSKAEAEATALDQFDLRLAGMGEAEAYSTEIIEGESK